MRSDFAARWAIKTQFVELSGVSSLAVAVCMVGLPATHANHSWVNTGEPASGESLPGGASGDWRRSHGRLRVGPCSCLPHPLAQGAESYVILENESDPEVPRSSPGLVSSHTTACPWKVPLRHPDGAASPQGPELGKAATSFRHVGVCWLRGWLYSHGWRQLQETCGQLHDPYSVFFRGCRF